MKCPHCSKDISEKLVLQEAARIMGRRGGRRKLTPEEAREMQRKGVEARKKRTADTAE